MKIEVIGEIKLAGERKSREGVLLIGTREEIAMAAKLFGRDVEVVSKTEGHK